MTMTVPSGEGEVPPVSVSDMLGVFGSSVRVNWLKSRVERFKVSSNWRVIVPVSRSMI